jgi:hypothetical protein
MTGDAFATGGGETRPGRRIVRVIPSQKTGREIVAGCMDRSCRFSRRGIHGKPVGATK